MLQDGTNTEVAARQQSSRHSWRRLLQALLLLLLFLLRPQPSVSACLHDRFTRQPLRRCQRRQVRNVAGAPVTAKAQAAVIAGQPPHAQHAACAAVGAVQGLCPAWAFWHSSSISTSSMMLPSLTQRLRHALLSWRRRQYRLLTVTSITISAVDAVASRPPARRWVCRGGAGTDVAPSCCAALAFAIGGSCPLCGSRCVTVACCALQAAVATSTAEAEAAEHPAHTQSGMRVCLCMYV